MRRSTPARTSARSSACSIARSPRILGERVDLRPATPDDVPAMQEIYAYHVLHGLASFEEEPPSAVEVRRRYEDVRARGLPWLAADFGGVLVGYGYCAPYRTRSAYRYSIEDSVYVRHGSEGRGVGSAILDELIRRVTDLGYRQLIAVIGDSSHAPSINLHARFGFLRVGTVRSVGYKFGRWVDTVVMQRPLGPGDGTPP
ncbi:MAG: N-acetyltransferase family protein [Betaproteobacteria bacterium]|nr:MAG: N-acetyltransferase family protein [Betaproteobacteria bacterium]